MKMAMIVLPEHDNEGKPLRAEHRRLTEHLLNEYGGYTRLYGVGGWRSPEGKSMVETVATYHVAMERQRCLDLRRTAAWLALIARQECVMIVTPNGDVEMVKPIVPSAYMTSCPFAGGDRSDRLRRK